MAQDSRAKRYHNALELGFILAVVMVGTSSARARAAAPVVSGRTVLETDAAHPGSTVKAAVVAEIAPGYHINDHVPSLDYLIPTEVKLDAAKPVSVSRAVYPKGVPRKFAFLDTPISVYEGKLSIGVLLKVEAGAAPGIYTLTGSLRYQACNERACLPPATVPLTLVVRVAPPGASLRRLNSDVFTRIKFNLGSRSAEAWLRAARPGRFCSSDPGTTGSVRRGDSPQPAELHAGAARRAGRRLPALHGGFRSHQSDGRFRAGACRPSGPFQEPGASPAQHGAVFVRMRRELGRLPPRQFFLPNFGS